MIKKIIFYVIIATLFCVIIYPKVYLFELGLKSLELGRTTAGIEDYKHFDVREIPKSENPTPLPIHSNYNLISETSSLKKLNNLNKTIAFLIIKNDSILHEKYYEGFGKNSKTNSFSMVKTIVSACLEKAIEEGKVQGYEQKVIDFLPWLKGPYAPEVSVGDLAKMSSGLKWKEDYFNLLTITPRTYITRNIQRVMKTIPIISPPGEKFNYQSGSTQLLSLVLESATDENISELVWRYFLNPLGVESESNWRLDSYKNNTEKSYCCFNSSARTFTRFALLFKNNGIWNGKQIISDKYVKKSTSPQLKNGQNYGYGWWIGKYHEKSFYSMRGHKGQYVFVFPNEDIVIVRLGREETSQDGIEYVEEVFEMLKNLS